MTNIVKDSEQFRITRETRAKSTYKYEFVLYVNKDSSSADAMEEVITATEVENGSEFEFNDIDNWTSVLTIFSEAYLQTESIEDGLDAVVREYEL